MDEWWINPILLFSYETRKGKHVPGLIGKTFKLVSTRLANSALRGSTRARCDRYAHFNRDRQVGQDTPIEISVYLWFFISPRDAIITQLEGFHVVLASICGIFRGVESFKTLVVKTVKIPKQANQDWCHHFWKHFDTGLGMFVFHIPQLLAPVRLLRWSWLA